MTENPDAPPPQDNQDNADAGAPAGPDVAALEAEIAALKDRMLRTMAEMENLRRRTEKEVADARAYGVQKFAADMLPFSDNILRALVNTPADVDGPAKALREGLEVMERDFASRLSRYGVKRMEPQGQKFDPNQHEALFEIPDETVPNGTVLQVVETGYTIGERTLRPAKVGVSRGAPR